MNAQYHCIAATKCKHIICFGKGSTSNGHKLIELGTKLKNKRMFKKINEITTVTFTDDILVLGGNPCANNEQSSLVSTLIDNAWILRGMQVIDYGVQTSEHST